MLLDRFKRRENPSFSVGDVVKIQNDDVLKKSIASGNYGHEDIQLDVSSIDMDNPIVKYLFNSDNEKNIVYWYKKILYNRLTWYDMWAYFRGIGLARIASFHPYDYGFKRFNCPPNIYCNDCHRKALRLLYLLYKSKL